MFKKKEKVQLTEKQIRSIVRTEVVEIFDEYFKSKDNLYIDDTRQLRNRVLYFINDMIQNYMKKTVLEILNTKLESASFYDTLVENINKKQLVK